MRSARDTQYRALPDGRRLCFAEYGDPAGRPVVLVHGNLNSRLLHGLIPGSPFLPGLRLIVPDRPGFGRSDFREGITTLENWSYDVAALADSLRIGRFAVFGASGGGPFALSCAWKIPERLTAAGVFASVGPPTSETAVGLAPPIRTLWGKAHKYPRLIRTQMRIAAFLARNFPGLYVRLVSKEFSDLDREVYDRLGIASPIRPDRNEGYRQGGVGPWCDTVVPGAWPIPLEQIATKVLLWQGEDDISITPSMGRHLADRIPGCETTFIPHAVHFWIFEHLGEMLDSLVRHHAVRPDSSCSGH